MPVTIPERGSHVTWWTPNGLIFTHCPEIADGFDFNEGRMATAGDTMCTVCGGFMVEYGRNPLPAAEMYDFVISGTPIGTWSCTNTECSHAT